jgi:hypothetical protein
MRRSHFFLALLALTLSSCAYNLVGADKDYFEVIYGTLLVNPITGRANVEAQALLSKVKCAGPASVNNSLRTVLVAEQTSGGVLLCENGRVINVSYAKTEQGNIGVGKDQYGNMFAFSFGMSNDEAAAKVNEYLQKASARVAPIKAK